MNKFFLYLNTVKFLKARQIFFQIVYKVKGWFPYSIDGYDKYKDCSFEYLTPKYLPQVTSTKFKNENTFQFLNITHSFGERIDWNFMKYGKLWNYNLQYGDYLLDHALSVDERELILLDISKAIQSNSLKLEPYPTSLRIVNSILFLSHYKIRNELISKILKQQIAFLESNLEYHIDGNHLLENSIALSLAFRFIANEKLQIKSNKLLLNGLTEQFLTDGAHYERSPMYHSIILSRLMSLFGIMNEQDVLYIFLKDKITLASSYLITISNDGKVFPLVQDSTHGIVAEPKDIMGAFKNFNIIPSQLKLSTSGFRILTNDNIFVLINCGNISPLFQPGHAHSDILSFVLYKNNEPIVVDMGISTYENNSTRHLERATSSHNTVCLNNEDQSEMWSAFRVGNRSQVIITKDEKNYLSAELQSYSSKNWRHKRSFELNDNQLDILDMTSCPEDVEQICNFHFNYDLEVILNSDHSLSVNNVKVIFHNPLKIVLGEYNQSLGFNNQIKAHKVSVYFKKELKTSIYA